MTEVHIMGETSSQQLPVEKLVLTQISRELNAADCKNANLVCQRWYMADDVVRFFTKEYTMRKPSQGSYSSKSRTIRTLSRSKPTFISLTFEGIDFRGKEFSLKFWQKNGSKVRAVEFIDCIFSSVAISNILTQCSRLVSFSLKDEGVQDIPQLFFDPLTGLSECTTLHSFSLVVENFERYTQLLPSNFLSYIFAISPNMKNLRICINEFKECVDDGSGSFYRVPLPGIANESTQTITKFAETITRKIFNHATSFESIEISVGNLSFDGPLCFRLSRCSLPNLKNLRVFVEWDPELCLSWHFFSQLPKLQHIDYAVWFADNIKLNSDVSYLAHIMDCLLNHCPDLKSMTITHCANFVAEKVILNESTTASLVKSNLVTLNCVNFYLELAPANGCNNKLKSLSVKRPPSDERYVCRPEASLSMYQTFRNLTSLEVPCIADDGLQLIFRFQTHLKILKLMSCDNCTDYGFSGWNPDGDQGYSIKNLKQLEHLELRMDFAPTLTSKTIKEFTLPHLSYLSIRISGFWRKWDKFIRYLYNCPALEKLHCYFEAEAIDYLAWVDLCRPLRFLQKLDISFRYGDDFSNEECEHIVACCPSLLSFRCIILSRLSDGIFCYERNPETEQMEPMAWQSMYQQFPTY